MKYFRLILALIPIGIMVLAISEIFSYMESPESYKLGSDAMVSNGGYKYKSPLTFVTFQGLQIMLSVLAVFFLLNKAKNLTLLLLTLLVVALQFLLLFVI